VKLDNEKWITVVSGLPRSGTSMMMRMLSAGGMPTLADNARPADEDNPFGYYELEAAKGLRNDSRWVRGAVGKAVKVVHLLVPELPPDYAYRVVMMRRDLHEVLASQRAMLQRHQRRGAELEPEKLSEVFSHQLRRALDWVRQQPHFSLVEVNYRDVIEQPATQAARVNGFLGGTLDVEKMIGAVEPSLYRHRSE
jgi:hypothetical protein